MACPRMARRPQRFITTAGLAPRPFGPTTKNAVIITGIGTGTRATETPAIRGRTNSILRGWGMKKNEHPVSVYSTGGIFGFTQDEGKTPGTMVYGGVETYGHDKTTQETPNTQTAAYTYADGTIIELETRGRYTNHEGSTGQDVGNIFYGTEGWLEISGHTWKAFRKRGKTALRAIREIQPQSRQSLGEFFGGDSLRERRRHALRHP